MAEYYEPETYPKEWNYLQTGTIIDQYVIERELAHGGFSSVYLARQTSDQVQVAIKEYLPRKLAHRTWNNVVVLNDEESRIMFKRGRRLFFEEARVLATLKHPNIVEVINFFEANSTVYMVMVYNYGVTLEKLLARKSWNITEAFVKAVFNSLLDGVGYIHQHSYLHLDIKPANILVQPGNDSVLLDFGAYQTFPCANPQQKTKVLTKGFSPIEQYDLCTPLGPWTDIYAIGASMRACLEMKSPQPAPERAEKDALEPVAKLFKRKYSEPLLNAIDWAMAISSKDRPQSAAELRAALNAEA
ncbi:serine/threonine protein kinase [Candidatus Methylomicrobium oryzae]|jgi:serine/threonine protein kinase|uniref:serine/threonine protein kinase n=1 Tax=Candidatus Methylomicrobium oryzae TaxID=2802053 RepID=UPI001921CE4D|nr:serine/threonine-protein kinase [Methylomicrobium sp. RS1]MBL1265942.1 serine/threonine protein kinase [Methylomicrobium sp. RS1]